MFTRIFVFVPAIALSACQPEIESVQPSWMAEIDSGFEEWAEETTAPSVVLGIYQDGDLIYANSWGLADLDREIPTTVDVAYEVGSISKHFNAVAIMQQVEAGHITLDDTIGSHVDGLPEAWHGVTISQLLSHTSGIPDYEAAATYTVYEAPAEADDIIAIVADMPMDFEPGTAFHYSNTGYYLLSLALESVTGQATATYFDEHLFQPAGMESASLGAREDVFTAQGYKPEGYNVGSDSLIATPSIYPRTTLGAGAVTLTLEDWSDWQHALANHTLISAESLGLTYEPVQLSSGDESQYGYGMFLSPRRKVERLSHSGQTSGYTAYYEYYPDTGLSFLTMTNLYGARVGRLVTRIARTLRPEMRYENWEVIEDADPADADRVRAALRQAARIDEGSDLLSDDLAAAVVDPQFASFIDELRGYVQTLGDLRQLHKDETDAGVRFIYAGEFDGGVKYYTLHFENGELSGLNWEDE